MNPPDVQIEPDAKRVLQQVAAAHPNRRLRIRHDGYG